MGKWFRGLESNQLPPAYEADERPVLFPGIEMDPPAGAAPAWSALRVRCIATSATEERNGLKWCSREDSHLELPPSQSGVQNSYTSGTWKNTAPCRCCPGAHGLEDRRACCYTNDATKMVAASGIAPDSPRLQRGANLSQLRSHGPSARYCAAVSRLSGEGSAFELRRNKEMVARCGNAPQFAGCRPAVLLLNYRAGKWKRMKAEG